MDFLSMKIGNDAAVFSNDIADLGKNLKHQYQTAKPFPHVVIDDFLPAGVLERVLDVFPKAHTSIQAFNRNQERFKKVYNPDDLDDLFTRSLFYNFNARPFVSFLENLTGIEGVVPDPYFRSGGFHEVTSGGHLSVHADFNIHRWLRLKRRVNVLIYMNKNWRKDYGGNLELWEKNMSKQAVSIVPLFNRCVIFNTEDNSFHGHPEPLNIPENMSRRSIALYYYTASDAIFLEHRAHTTNFRVRKRSPDTIDWGVKYGQFINDFFPPIFLRLVRAGKKRIRSVLK